MESAFVRAKNQKITDPRTVISDQISSRIFYVLAGLSLRERIVETAEKNIETWTASKKIHAYLTNSDNGEGGEGKEEKSRRIFTVTERVFLPTLPLARLSLSLSFTNPSYIFLFSALLRLVNSPGRAAYYWIISGACRRRQSQVDPRSLARVAYRSISPRVSVNGSEAERADDPRDRRRDATRRDARSRSRSRARGRRRQWRTTTKARGTDVEIYARNAGDGWKISSLSSFVVDACVARPSLFLSPSPFLSFSLLQRSAVLQNDVNGPALAIDITPHRDTAPPLLHTRWQRERRRQRWEGEREMRDRETARSFADQNKTRRCSFSSSASSPDADSRTIIRAVAADTAAVPTTNERTNERINQQALTALSPVLVSCVSLYRRFFSLAHSLRAGPSSSSSSRVYACVVRDDPSATSSCQLILHGLCMSMKNEKDLSR